jgi:hypothetical protein
VALDLAAILKVRILVNGGDSMKDAMNDERKEGPSKMESRAGIGKVKAHHSRIAPTFDGQPLSIEQCP